MANRAMDVTLRAAMLKAEEAWDTVRWLYTTPGLCPTADEHLREAAAELNAAVQNMQRAMVDFALHGEMQGARSDG